MSNTPDWHTLVDNNEKIEHLNAEVERLQSEVQQLRAELAAEPTREWYDKRCRWYASELDKLKSETDALAKQLQESERELLLMKTAHVHPSIRWSAKQMWNFIMGRDVSTATVAEVTQAIEAKRQRIEKLESALKESRDFVAKCVGQFDPQLPDNAGSKVAASVHDAAYSLLLKLNEAQSVLGVGKER